MRKRNDFFILFRFVIAITTTSSCLKKRETLVESLFGSCLPVVKNVGHVCNDNNQRNNE